MLWIFFSRRLKLLEQKPPHEPEKLQEVSESFKARVLENLKTYIKGNGIKTDSVQLNKIDTQILSVHAKTTLTTKIKTERVVRPGKVGGDVVHAQNLLLPGLETKMNAMIASPSVRTDIIKAVLARSDKGFQPAANFALNLNAYKGQVAAYDGCLRCHHTGRMTCVSCQGGREVTCPRCTGSRTILCIVCNGARQLHTPQGPKPCTQCASSGRLACPQCHQKARIPCASCQAQGSLACEPCGGTGWTSTVMIGQLEGQGHFELDDRNIPPLVAERIRSTGAKAVLSHDWQITPNTQNNEDDLGVFYTLSAPYATFQIALGKLVVDGAAFGTQARIIDAPPFLEKILYKPIKILLEAARQKNNLTSALEAAGKYRLLREALMLVTRSSPAKAMTKLRGLYPVGIHLETLAKIIEAADIVLRAGTEKARIQGLIAGILLAGLFYAAIKMLHVYDLIIPQTDSASFYYIWLIVIALSGISVLHITIRLFGRYAARKLLSKVFKPEQLQKMMPRAGRLFYAGAFICLCIFSTFEFYIFR